MSRVRVITVPLNFSEISAIIFNSSHTEISSPSLPDVNFLGARLVELLNLVVHFVIGHVHPYHGMVPDSTSVNGVTSDKLLEELRNANEKILNKYIRIN